MKTTYEKKLDANKIMLKKLKASYHSTINFFINCPKIIRKSLENHSLKSEIINYFKYNVFDTFIMYLTHLLLNYTSNFIFYIFFEVSKL